MSKLEQYVRDLVHEGFAVVPRQSHTISITLIEEATAAQHALIKAIALLELESGTSFIRPGEFPDYDIGLIQRRKKEGKDTKYYFHYTHELERCMMMRPLLAEVLKEHRYQFQVLSHMQDELNRFTLQVLDLVQEMIRPMLLPNVDLVKGFKLSYQKSIPFSVTVLRGLLYLASENHTGAKGHIDRDLLTAHLGDVGGTLLGHREFGPGQSFEVSPPSGQILLFWGIRATIVSMGLLKPLYHSATANPGQDRQAMVQFCNLPWPQIPYWEYGVDFFKRAFGVRDFADWYQLKMRGKEWAVR